MRFLSIIILLMGSFSLFSQNNDNSEIISKINGLRTKKGISLLKYDGELYEISKEWGEYVFKNLNKYSDSEITSIHIKNRNSLHIKYFSRLKKSLKNKRFSEISENIQYSTINGKFKEELHKQSFENWRSAIGNYEMMMRKDRTHCAYHYLYDAITKRLLCILLVAKEL